MSTGKVASLPDVVGANLSLLGSRCHELLRFQISTASFDSSGLNHGKSFTRKESSTPHLPYYLRSQPGQHMILASKPPRSFVPPRTPIGNLYQRKRPTLDVRFPWSDISHTQAIGIVLCFSECFDIFQNFYVAAWPARRGYVLKELDVI